MSVTSKKTSEPKASNNTDGTDLSQFGYFFDQTRCTGCYTCIVACKDWHDVPAGPASWIRVSTIERGKYPNPFLAFDVNLCHHCVNATCVAACPTEAISKREADGIVVVDREKCVGRDECGHPCSRECPAGNDVLGFVSLIREGKYAEAWRLIVESNPFPGVCGRVCFHPCESACNRSQVDEPLAIHALERLAAENRDTMPPLTAKLKKQRVAIVGSGPAGLSCAYQLTQRGYRVTVFEALPVVGGMLRVGIPEYRLPIAVLDREIAFIKATGDIEIKTNMRLGENLSLEELDQFDAVFLALGAHKQKTLNIPGLNLKKVIPGLDFLKKVKLEKKVNIGKRVIVLGGGNVAFDCALTAHRLGATEVHLICPESYDKMLADPPEIRQGEEEGIVIHPSRLVSEIIGKNGDVAGIEYFSLRSMEFDKDGKLHFDAIAGSEAVLLADTVILAIGQEPDLSFLPKDIKVSRGIISINEEGATSREKYFAGGDVATAEGRVAWAIGSGRRAAQAIDRYLMDLPEQKLGEKLVITESKLLDSDFIEKRERVKVPTLSLTDRLQNFAEVELGLDSEQAKAEANRCLICRGMCFVACPYKAPQFGAEDNPKMQKCDLCLDRWSEKKKPICVAACPLRALDAGLIEELKTKYGDIREAEGFVYFEKVSPSIIFKPKSSPS